MEGFSGFILAIGSLVLIVYVVFMTVAPISSELVPEKAFNNCGTHEYNNKIYRISIDTVLSDSLYNTKNWR